MRKIKNYYLHRRLGRPRRPPCGFRGSAGRDNRVPSLVVQITRDLRLPRRALPTSTSSSLRTSVVQSLGSSPAMHTRTLAVSRDTRALMPPSPQRRPVAVVGIFSPPTLIHLFFISSRDSLGPDRRKKIPKPFFPPAHAKRVLRDTRAHSRHLRNGGRRRYIPPPDDDATDFDSFVFYIFSRFPESRSTKKIPRPFFPPVRAKRVLGFRPPRSASTRNGRWFARRTAESCK